MLLVAIGWKPESFQKARNAYCQVARKRRLSVMLVFVLGLMGHLVERDYVVPPPGFHDEFSYLLAGDTFASGRLTNPPHPMRYFFESIHILMEPSYMSMYPPGQGLMLATGMALGGNAIMGVWLSVALCCASICWMLQAWATPGWALAGGLIAVVRIGWFSYWAHSYWGGAVPAIGGALLLGVIPRMIKRPTPVLGCVFSSAALILINSRPFEGAVLIATVSIWLLVSLKHRLRSSIGSWLLKFARPAFILLLLGFGWTAFYNWRVTGNPLRPAYVEDRDQYETHGSFVWQTPKVSRVYNHGVIGRFYRETEGYVDLYPYWHLQLEKPINVWFFFLGPALTLPFLFSLRSIPGRRMRLIWLAVLTAAAAHLAVAWRLQPHYAAPLTGAIYVLCIEGLRRMALWQRSRRYLGVQMQRAVLATCLLMVMLRTGAPAYGIPVFQEQTLPWYSYGLGANFSRAKMEERLTKMGGHHLILVQYSARHAPETEWVYNRADIDAAPVVWARYVDDKARLQQLLTYFSTHRIWIVFPDERPNQIFDFREHYK
jgi:hypothetical protein